MKRKHKRLTFVVVALCLLGSAAALMLTAFEENIVFFFSPTDIVEQEKGTDDRRFRLGGLVEEGSVDRSAGKTIAFRVTDISNAVPVQFTGILPDLFREGQGIVAEGRLVDGVFVADEVLAKHDEQYMPPEVADALKKSGQWKESTPKTKSEY